MEAEVGKKAGLLGVSEVFNDMRDLREAIAHGNVKARLAVEKFTWTIAKRIGGCVAELGGLTYLSSLAAWEKTTFADPQSPHVNMIALSLWIE